MINLTRKTKPSSILMLIKYIKDVNESGSSPLSELDIFSAKKLLILADILKMRSLEKELLTVVIIQKLDRDNVIEFLNISHSKSVEKKFAYRNE